MPDDFTNKNRYLEKGVEIIIIPKMGGGERRKRLHIIISRSQHSAILFSPRCDNLPSEEAPVQCDGVVKVVVISIGTGGKTCFNIHTGLT